MSIKYDPRIGELLDNVSNMRRLSFLSVQGIELHRHEIDKIARCTTLKHLNLTFNKLDDSDLANLKHLLTITNLELSGNPITRLDCAKDLKSLKWLHLDDTRFSDIGLDSLAASPVETLLLDGSKLTDEGISYVNRMPRP